VRGAPFCMYSPKVRLCMRRLLPPILSVELSDPSQTPLSGFRVSPRTRAMTGELACWYLRLIPVTSDSSDASSLKIGSLDMLLSYSHPACRLRDGKADGGSGGELGGSLKTSSGRTGGDEGINMVGNNLVQLPRENKRRDRSRVAVAEDACLSTPHFFDQQRHLSLSHPHVPSGTELSIHMYIRVRRGRMKRSSLRKPLQLTTAAVFIGCYGIIPSSDSVLCVRVLVVPSLTTPPLPPFSTCPIRVKLPYPRLFASATMYSYSS
jgi:hypothetical protein